MSERIEMWFKEDTVNQIDIHKAKELIDQQDVTIVDIRDDQSFLEGHIAKAVQVNDGNIDDFLKNIDKQKTIICYSHPLYRTSHKLMSLRAAAPAPFDRLRTGFGGEAIPVSLRGDCSPALQQTQCGASVGQEQAPY